MKNVNRIKKQIGNSENKYLQRREWRKWEENTIVCELTRTDNCARALILRARALRSILLNVPACQPGSITNARWTPTSSQPKERKEKKKIKNKRESFFFPFSSKTLRLFRKLKVIFSIKDRTFHNVKIKHAFELLIYNILTFFSRRIVCNWSCGSCTHACRQLQRLSNFVALILFCMCHSHSLQLQFTIWICQKKLLWNLFVDMHFRENYSRLFWRFKKSSLGVVFK